jgi:hypothetical protein
VLKLALEKDGYKWEFVSTWGWEIPVTDRVIEPFLAARAELNCE